MSSVPFRELINGYDHETTKGEVCSRGLRKLASYKLIRIRNTLSNALLDASKHDIVFLRFLCKDLNLELF